MLFTLLRMAHLTTIARLPGSSSVRQLLYDFSDGTERHCPHSFPGASSLLSIGSALRFGQPNFYPDRTYQRYIHDHFRSKFTTETSLMEPHQQFSKVGEKLPVPQETFQHLPRTMPQSGRCMFLINYVVTCLTMSLLKETA